MKKLVIAAVVVAAVGGGLYANHYATQEVKKVVDQQLASLEQQSGVVIEYKDIAASVFSESMQLSGVTIVNQLDNTQIAEIEQIEIEGYETDRIAPHTEFVMTNFRFSDAYLAQMPQGTNDTLTKTSYDLKTTLDYNEQSGDSDFALKLDANGVADFSFDLGLAKSTALMEASLAASQAQNAAIGHEIPLEQQLQQQSEMMAALSELEPRSVAIDIANRGELKAVVESLLEAQGMTHEQFQQVVAMQLQQAPVSAKLSQAITDFANGLNALTLSAKLPEGKTMMEINQQIMALMGQPEELAKFINLEAKGE